MRSSVLCFSLLLLWSSNLSRCLADDSPRDVEAAEELIVAHRHSMKSGIVELHSSVEFSDGRNRDSKYVVYFDESSYRVDTDDQYEMRRSGRISNAYSWGTDATRRYSTTKTDDGANVVSMITHSDDKEHGRFSDVRLLGMYPETLANLKAYALNSRIGKRSAGTRVAIEDAEPDGSLKKISYIEKWGKDEVWFSPNQDGSITQMKRLDKDGELLRSMQISLQNVEGFGWFPLEVKYERFQDGELAKSELLKVKVVQLNKAIPSETWTFRGMGAPLGHKILNYSNGEMLYLDQDGVQLADTSDMSSVLIQEADGIPVWYAVGVVCLVFSGALMYRRFSVRA